LTGKGLSTLENANDVRGRLAHSARREHGGVAPHAVQLDEIFAHPPCDFWRVEFDLYGHPS
jgi:hypothetical protein